MSHRALNPPTVYETWRTATGPGINIPQLWDLMEGGLAAGPLFVRHRKWSPSSCVCVMGSAPDWKDWMINGPPYFTWDSPKRKHNAPEFFGVAFWSYGRRYQGWRVRSPGTFMYDVIEPPRWWCAPDEEATVRLICDRRTYRVRFNLAGSNDADKEAEDVRDPDGRDQGITRRIHGGEWDLRFPTGGADSGGGNTRH